MWRSIGILRQAKLILVRFVRLRGEPDEIAKGVALGIFIGMTPTFGLQMIIAIFLAFLLKENRLAALVGVWVTNPVTAPVIYAIEYEIGRIILSKPRAGLPEELTFGAFAGLGYDVLVPLWLGSMVAGVLCGSLAYFLTLRLIPAIKSWRIPRWPRENWRRRK
ncbi:MAG TPA: DUF2062 domain-containing protein [Desulfuromonadales bacterium]|nr:DUF2062 domain-containing protein [Desulfuromonadales bacterium]